MNLRRFFGILPTITTYVVGILSFVSSPITSSIISPITTLGLPDDIRCPELFEVLNTELFIPGGYWQSVCNGVIPNNDESGSGSGEYTDDKSRSNVFCQFVCNDYHNGCRDLAKFVFSNEVWVRKLGCSRQTFLLVCIGWQEYIRETNHNRTTPTLPSTTPTHPSTTPTHPSTTILLTLLPNNSSSKKETTSKPWDIGIITVLGLAISIAGGVAIYFYRKRP